MAVRKMNPVPDSRIYRKSNLIFNIMEHLRQFFCIASILFLLSSCADDSVTVVDSFPDEGELELVGKTNYDPAEYNIGWYIESNGYFVYRLWDEPFFALLDKDRNGIARFGKRGRGVGEYLSPDVIRTVPGKGDTLDIITRELTRGCLYRTSVNTKDGGHRTVLEKDFGAKLLREVHDLGGGAYLCCEVDNRYYLLNADGSKQYLEGWSEEEIDFPINPSTEMPVFQSMGKVSPDSPLFVIYSSSFPMLILHDIQGSRLKTMHIKEIPENLAQPSTVGAFCDLDFIGDKIVAVYESLEEEDAGYYLCIFDRNFKPLKRYPLPVWGNALNIDRTTGIANILNSSDKAIYGYDLSEWL